MSEINARQAKREIGFVYIRYLLHWTCLSPMALALMTIFLLADYQFTALINSRSVVVVPLTLWIATSLLLVRSMLHLKNNLHLNQANIETIHEYNVDHKLLNHRSPDHFRHLSVMSYVLAGGVPIVMAVSYLDGMASTAAKDATSVALHWFAFHTLIFFAVYMGQFHEAAIRSK